MILFVGPLPPPLHGFSFINGEMLARFRAAPAAVSVFNRAPAPSQGRVASWWQAAAAWLGFVRALGGAPRASALYMGFSGGLGQLVDLAYLLVARLSGRPVVMHHHSFAYLRQRPTHTALVLRCARRARHIVLCDCMADALSRQYGIARAQIDVVSNAAFLPPAQALDRGHQPAASLQLGFLSNITAEKGIFAFFDLLTALRARGVAVQARVAGPVAPDIAQRFAQALAAQPDCQHLGPVYGEAKAQFYQGLDVLVFPTFYNNEAEPVTLLEALRVGLPVLANARGCIADLVPAGAGVVLHDDARFVDQAADTLQAWARQSTAQWQQRYQQAQQAFVQLRAEHAQRLAGIVQRMTRGGSA
ncbi:MAG: glycosyl transferase [Burkholderiales bacterium PBB5]|nr:MAG: glycosyl transferase [Burkholderiales bacterium PBB5]